MEVLTITGSKTANWSGTPWGRGKDGGVQFANNMIGEVIVTSYFEMLA